VIPALFIAAALLWPLAETTESFEACNAAPQYARIEVVSAIPALQCPIEALGNGDVLPLVATALGTVYYACAVVQSGERARIIILPGATSDGMLGHELRHVFPPHDFHFLGFDLPCDMQ